MSLLLGKFYELSFLWDISRENVKKIPPCHLTSHSSLYMMSFHRIIHSLVTIVGSIYPIEIEIKDTTDIAKTAMNTLDLHL